MASHLNNIIKREDDSPLTEVLDSEECIRELHSQNQKLIDYFTYDKCSELLNYIIQEPEDNSDSKRMFKFPFISSELFVCECDLFLLKFFKNFREESPSEQSLEQSDEEGGKQVSNEEKSQECEAVPMLIEKVFEFLDMSSC